MKEISDRRIFIRMEARVNGELIMNQREISMFCLDDKTNSFGIALLHEIEIMEHELANYATTSIKTSCRP
jgi:hypothetical protein